MHLTKASIDMSISFKINYLNLTILARTWSKVILFALLHLLAEWLVIPCNGHWCMLGLQQLRSGFSLHSMYYLNREAEMAFLSLLCTFQPNLGSVFLSDTVNMSTLEIVVLFVFYEQQVAASAQCSVSSAVLSQRHCVMDSRLTYHLLELMLLMNLLMLIFPLLLISRINHNSIH